MSDTSIQTIDENALVDLFPTIGQQPDAPKFSSESQEFDILNTPKPTSTTDTTTEAPKENEGRDQETVEVKDDADILGTGGTPAPVISTGISDLSTYYEDRIKNGKFVAINEEDDKGNVKPFIPKTAEEYDEVLELQINYRLDEAKKDLEKRWYESKTPAWKVVSRYAELVDDPSQLIPFLQGVKIIQSVEGLNENEIDGAEQIVRARLEQTGDPEEVIASQINALKTTDTLISTAKSYKPLLLQKEKVMLQQQLKQREDEERVYQVTIDDIRNKALSEIEKPIFGKNKLKQEEKAAIYDLIAEPAEETQGYAIYTAIDQLFDKRDFGTLKEIALLLAKKDSFYNYLGISNAEKTAASLEKKLRLAGESRSASGNDYDEEVTRAAVSRNQFKTKPSFGR